MRVVIRSHESWVLGTVSVVALLVAGAAVGMGHGFDAVIAAGVLTLVWLCLVGPLHWVVLVVCLAFAVVPDSRLPVLELFGSVRLALLDGVAVLVCARWLMSGGHRVQVSRWALVGWACVSLAVLVGSITAGAPAGVVRYFGVLLLPYIGGALLGENPAAKSWFIRALMIAGVTVAVLALVELASGRFVYPTEIMSTGFTRAGLLRAKAGFGHPLSLGMFLCLTAFLPLVVIRRRSLAVIAVCLIGLGVVATLSRSPILGLLAGGIWLAVVRGRRRALAVLLILSALIALIAFVPGVGPDAFRSFLRGSVDVTNEAASSVTGRVGLLEAGFSAVRTRPVFGFGFGSTSGGEATFVSLYGKGYSDVASLPLAMLVETGVLGLLGLALITASSLHAMGRGAGSAELQAGVVAALVTSIGVTSLAVVSFTLFLFGLYSRLPANVASEVTLDSSSGEGSSVDSLIRTHEVPEAKA